MKLWGVQDLRRAGHGRATGWRPEPYLWAEVILLLMAAFLATTTSASAAQTYLWTQQAPATSPGSLGMASMTYDSSTGDVVLFGGDVGSTPVNETWVWNGSVWSQVVGVAGCTTACAGSPPPRSMASMVYDPSTGDVVLFGGFNGSTELNDTWLYNGTSWTEQTFSTSPAVREVATMAYDAGLSSIVLFGGNSAGLYFNDTWIYNGTTWTQAISPGCTTACPSSPPGRQNATMSYDGATGQLVVFGGSDGSFLNDTWVYSNSASTWSQVAGSGCTNTCTGSPSPREEAVMTYDPATGQVVLFGGATSSTSVVNDTWGYTSSGWSQVIDPGCTSGSFPAKSAYRGIIVCRPHNCGLGLYYLTQRLGASA